MKKLYIILFFIMVIASSALAQSSFSGDRLSKACEDYVYMLLGNNIELRISKSIRDHDFEENGVTARCSGSKESFRGNCFVIIEFNLNEKIIKRLQVPARVIIYKEVPVAAENISRGEIIEPNKISIEKKDITYHSEKDIPSSSEISGLTASRNISKGTIITHAFIEKQGTIKRGEKVNIIVHSGSVIVRTTGQALSDAATGESIRVKREGTQTILEGLVAMDGTVFINAK